MGHALSGLTYHSQRVPPKTRSWTALGTRCLSRHGVLHFNFNFRHSHTHIPFNNRGPTLRSSMSQPTAAAAAFVSGLWAIRLRHQQQRRLQGAAALVSRRHGYVTDNSSGCKSRCCYTLRALGNSSTAVLSAPAMSPVSLSRAMGSSRVRRWRHGAVPHSIVNLMICTPRTKPCHLRYGRYRAPRLPILCSPELPL